MITQRMSPDIKTQRVVCAALRLPEGITVTGARHFDIGMLEQIKRMDVSGVNVEQGFIDQWSNFLTREHAFEIAARQGQILATPHKEGHLFSEDIY